MVAVQWCFLLPLQKRMVENSVSPMTALHRKLLHHLVSMSISTYPEVRVHVCVCVCVCVLQSRVTVVGMPWCLVCAWYVLGVCVTESTSKSGCVYCPLLTICALYVHMYFLHILFNVYCIHYVHAYNTIHTYANAYNTIHTYANAYNTIHTYVHVYCTYVLYCVLVLSGASESAGGCVPSGEGPAPLHQCHP